MRKWSCVILGLAAFSLGQLDPLGSLYWKAAERRLPQIKEESLAAPTPFETIPKTAWIAESNRAFVIDDRDPQAPIHFLVADLGRYPSFESIRDWMRGAGFRSVRRRVVERFRDKQVGKAVLDEPMLRKNATSQLTLLTDEEYSAGIARIRVAVTRAEAAGEEAVFPMDVSLVMVTGEPEAGGTS